MVRKNLIRLLAPLALLGLLACQSEVKQGLTENQADEIVDALTTRGISAEKKAIVQNRDRTYTVLTNRTKMDDARHVLVVLGLPRDKIMGIDEICGKSDGIIPSPSIDRCKLQVATQNEIAKSLLLIDGVVSAKVTVVVPEKEPLSDTPQAKPSAAVVIKYLPDETGKPPFIEKQVRELVANSVDHLDYNDVSILATPSRSVKALLEREEDIKPGLAKTEKQKETKKIEEASAQSTATFNSSDDASTKKMKTTILVLSVFFMLLGGGLIAIVVHSRNVKAAQDAIARQQRRQRMQAQRQLKPSASAGSSVPAVVNIPGNVTMPSGFDVNNPGPGNGPGGFGVN